MTKYIEVCPKCGSINIGSQGYRILNSFCKDCGYGEKSPGTNTKTFFPEVDETKLEQFRKDLKNG
jgi:hypothetical protein